VAAVNGLDATVAVSLGSFALDVRLSAVGVLAVVGRNGAGKSTLLRALLGSLPQVRGRVAIGGEVLFDSATGVDVPLEARRIGFVPQGFALVSHWTVVQNLRFAIESSRSVAQRASRGQMVDQVLHEHDLLEVASRVAGSLSGGERQRVALARALAIAPRLMLLDEPLAALDAGSRPQVRGRLAASLEALTAPTLITTHDWADVRALNANVIVLDHGRVAQEGSIADVEQAPGTPFVADLISGRS
jgi:molybdate transport system ATP-binding protein